MDAHRWLDYILERMMTMIICKQANVKMMTLTGTKMVSRRVGKG
ncbi:hypothetical protein NXZ84_05775 [Mechercharimyces sp. CAU 1602]|nr:hypothetical protein [Mechercharimyces sp. CAU 1602]